MISYAKNLKTSWTNKLTKNVDELGLNVKTLYEEGNPASYKEFFNSNELIMVKPFFDIDCLIDTSEDDTEVETFKDITDNYYEVILPELSSKLGISHKNARICENHRKVKNKKFKISYHINYVNFKTTMNGLSHFYIENRAWLDEHSFDSSIYRNGLNKWRMPYCKKTHKDIKVMLPINKEPFRDFIIQLTDMNDVKIFPEFCDDLELKSMKAKSVKKHNKKFVLKDIQAEIPDDECYDWIRKNYSNKIQKPRL